MADKVLRLIEEAMEVEEGSIALGQALEWDSIAVVTFMALVDEHLDKRVSADLLNKCETVDDVVELVD
ncbi:acyl carrier protein [Pseudomonas sp. S5F11]|uniref:acyl carrier protein n=1 Tax=Pseudomonas sp. S5F11 TaxID=2866385 RepID=UPI001C7CE3DF|nr:acyl carrier protein [Pseudomonas sp. S5F11]MBX4135797.1 acyl carrier protein [Pseudomonas sp. S5F11]